LEIREVNKKSKKDKYEIQEDIKDKIEELLRAYPSLLEYLQDNADIIEILREDGLSEKSKDIIGGSGGGGGKRSSEYDKLESKENQVNRTNRKVQKITRILNNVETEDIKEFKTNTYYKIIKLIYFETNTQLEASLELNISDSTVRRHQARLLYKIALKLFGYDAIKGGLL